MRARARMLAWKISIGTRVNSLSGPWPMLLYTWLIPHADNLGRFHGEPEQVKATVFPRRRDVTIEQVEVWLIELRDADLIHWYQVDGMRYLQFPLDDWGKHQRLSKNMSRTSDLPDCTDSVRTAYVQRRSNGHPEVEGEVEGEEEREVEGEGEPREEGARNGHVNPVRYRESGFKTGNPEALRQAQALREKYPEAFS